MRKFKINIRLIWRIITGHHWEAILLILKYAGVEVEIDRTEGKNTLCQKVIFIFE